MIAAFFRESEGAIAERLRFVREGVRFDVVGFALVATFLGALEIMLDRGLMDDWFGSSFIVWTAVVCALAFVLMIPWEMSRRDPMIDVRMVATRQFGACFVVMLATGAILYATTQFLPLLVQSEFGYTATWAGLVLSPGGLVTMAMMVVVGRCLGRVQPKYLIMAGAAFTAFSMYDLTNVYGDLGFWFFAKSRMTLGVGLPLIFIPIIAASYDGHTAQQDGSGLGADQRGAQHRRLDGRLARLQRAHRIASSSIRARLVERCDPVEPQYQKTLHQATQYFQAQGSSLAAGAAAAGFRLDRPAGADPGGLPCLHRRVLGPDAASARRHSAGAEPAQGEARRRRSRGALIAMLATTRPCGRMRRQLQPAAELSDARRS